MIRLPETREEKISRMRELMRAELRVSDLSPEQRKNIRDYFPHSSEQELREQLEQELGHQKETDEYIAATDDYIAETDEYIAEISEFLSHKTQADQLVPENTVLRSEERRRIDENWSLGAVRNLQPPLLGANPRPESDGFRSGGGRERSLGAQNHTVEIVQALDVSVDVDLKVTEPFYAPPETGLRKSSLVEQFSSGERTSVDSIFGERLAGSSDNAGDKSAGQVEGTDVSPSPSQARLPPQPFENGRGGDETETPETGGQQDTFFGRSTPPDLPDLLAATDTDESDSDSDSDSDTWGGTFSLKHICCR